MTRRFLSADTHTPRSCWFTYELAPASVLTYLGSESEHRPNLKPPSAQSPFAAFGVTVARETSWVSWRGVTPSSSLLRAHAPNLCPSLASGICLLLAVFAGCYQPQLRRGPSRGYLCLSFPACLVLYPGSPLGAFARFFPRDIGLPYVNTRSALHIIPDSYFNRGVYFVAADIR